jgi:hypothetical protein
MTQTFILCSLLSLLLALSACSSMPQMFWEVDGQGGPAYARGASGSPNAKSRPMLEVPPELRSELELPENEDIGMKAGADKLPKQYRRAVAGKAVALHARLYDVTPKQLFSAVVDAMTSLNLPVDSVDSPSGIITTEWIRKGSNNAGGMFGLGNLFGGFGVGLQKIHRYRFIVRIFKVNADTQFKSRLEVRLLSQVHMNRHWVNRPINNKPGLKLFAAVEKQLGRKQPQ